MLTLLGLSCMARANPIHQGPVFFENRTLHTIYLLPETGGAPVAVHPGERAAQPMDAWADPTLYQLDHKMVVYKIVDNISVVYERDGRVITWGGSFNERMGQYLEGGWKDLTWARANPYFGDFFDAVMALPKPE